MAVPARPAEPICNALTDLGQGVESLRRGDPEAAVRSARGAWAALPQGPVGARAAATLGLALLEAHRPGEALGPLQAALTAPPEGAGPALRLALARALLAAGHPLEAAVRLARDASPGPAARWLEAEALLGAGQAAAATGRLEALVARGGDEVAVRHGRLLLAGAWRRAGRVDEALASLKALAVEEVDRPEGIEAAAALQGWAEGGELRARLSGSDRLRRAERLLRRGRPTEALAEADQAAGSLPPASPSAVALVQAIALASVGRLADAAERIRPLEESPDRGVRRGAQWLLARAASRAGRVEEASRRHAAVALSDAVVPGLGERRSRELGEESAYQAAWLWHDAGQHRKAVARLDAFARAWPSSPRADDARWVAAWASWRAGDRPGALARLAALEGGPLAEAALYWGGRLGGNSPRARDRLRRSALLGGDGWYGQLARRRLEQLGAPLDEPAATAPGGPAGWLGPGAAAGAPGERLRAAAALFGLGARTQALQLLEEPARGPSSRAAAVELCRLASAAGEPNLAFRAARDLLGQGRETDRWLYPAAFEEELGAAARQAGVDPALLAGLVRRESAFRPEAQSLAGAVGLGQLLPRTAERLGLMAGLPGVADSRLAEPATNLALSALYLGLLRDRFGSDAGAVAAYNAGPAPPSDWARSGAGQPLDEWVENIPYRETRLYLKTVLASQEVYRRLAGRPPALDPGAPVPSPGPGTAF